MTNNGKIAAADVVAKMKSAGVVVVSEEELVERLSAPGPALDVCRKAILSAGYYGVRFKAAHGGIDEPLLVEAFSAVLAPEDAALTAKLLLTNLYQPPRNADNKQDDDLEGFRKLVRHGYLWIVVLCVAIVVGFAVKTSLAKAIVIALAFYPLLTAGWYYTTKDVTHGPKFKQMSRTAQINTLFRVAGLFMSAAAFFYAVPKLF
ncbi:TPA: hypothetical protein ACGW3N_000409 [Pseudomonas aeruginosa]|nr:MULTISPECIES: hypothetical protein [Pseudomonas]ELG7182112.1 hypothetical protein [Pseudomonas aeruginosa]MBH4094969.1 hypothetical protein [Pseudomonas aeruginosa]MBI6603314.1 hypothetical protein [Pseudomonas sp. S4_EA_1b]MBI8852509.1 hypothetical protein [Pseudomonas aeruginosa]HDU2622320.1 hypothetical protein [Pseudomonas aeruginosa]